VRMQQKISALVTAVVALITVACARQGDAREQAAAPDYVGNAIQPAPATPPPPPPLPTGGNGSFAVGPGGGQVVGTGQKRIRYRVELENGISWGENVVWTPADFARWVDDILAAPQGWTESAKHPVTNRDVGLANASWSFQRVNGGDFDVQVRLATAGTVQRLCAAVGINVDAVYSCRFGKTLMINLTRWLNGAEGYPVSLPDYRAAVINHEMGHFLGFDHMKCPGPGKPGPIMMTQTIDLQGCAPNVHPFLPDGTFPVGAFVQS
jgi:Protein of unknown function (DUF3152)